MTSNITALDILRTARTLIESEDCWAQDCDALDAEGNHTKPTAENATRWCISGSLIKAEQTLTGETTHPYLSEAQEPSEALMEAFKAMADLIPAEDRPHVYVPTTEFHANDVTLMFVNDISNHDEVMELFDRAIESLGTQTTSSQS